MKHKKRGDKTRTLLMHFKQRMSVRYGIDIQQKHMDSIAHQMKNHEHVVLEKQSNMISVILVNIEDTMIPIIWDNSRKVPVTALKQEWREELAEVCV